MVLSIRSNIGDEEQQKYNLKAYFPNDACIFCAHSSARHDFAMYENNSREKKPHFTCYSRSHCHVQDRSRCRVEIHPVFKCPYCKTSLMITAKGFECPVHKLVVREATNFHK